MNQAESTPQDNQMSVDITIWQPFRPRMSFLTPREYPEQCHVFLAKITAGLVKAQRYFMTIDDRPRSGFGMAEDCAQVMSSQMFREFCVPYTSELFDTFGVGFQDGRGLHMCGQSTHLHQALVDDLHVSSFNIFGYAVDPKLAAKNLGSRMYLWGNINLMLMLNGTKAQVKQAALAALEAMAPCGGFMLGDGANVCPGTPTTYDLRFATPGLGKREEYI